MHEDHYFHYLIRNYTLQLGLGNEESVSEARGAKIITYVSPCPLFYISSLIPSFWKCYCK